MKSISRQMTLMIQISAACVPIRLSTCQLREMFSVWPDRVRVPMISNEAVEAMSDAPMTKLRKVWTAITSLLGLFITLITHSERASSLMP